MAISRFLKDSSLGRREFIRASSIAGAGFMVGCATDNTPVTQAPQAAAQSEPLVMGHFVKIGADNRVTVVIKHLDKGQGVTTGLTAIVAEELDADWDQMDWEFAPSDPSRYNNLLWGPYQGTGGSTAVANSWMQLRKAGAAAKAMLVQAAAKSWGVDPASISVSKGTLSSGGNKASFGELAVAAAQETPPQEPGLKSPVQFTLIGTHMPRIDSAEKSTGQARYTIDVRLPNMHRAVLAHPPQFGATPKSVDDTAARAIDGVVDVVTTPRGVAVIAKDYWTASRGRDALKIDWDNSQAETRGSEQLWQEYRALADKPGAEVRNDGDVDAAFAGAAEVVEMDFEFPFLAHATMEPMNCVIDLRDDSCHVYTGSQIPGVDQFVVSQVTGTAPEKVFIHTQFAGGSFGRRAVPDSDFVMEAAMVAKATGGAYPVLMQWSREDDTRGGRYRPMVYHRLKGAVDSDGNISAWQHRAVSQSILRGTPFEGMISGPVDPTITEGAHNLPYRIANFRMDGHETKVGVPVLWWRSVGHTHNAYVTEVFFDELARRANKDAVALRMELLEGHPRHQGVLKLAAEKAGWGKDLPANRAMGVAVHESFSSFVAEVAEVSLADDGSYKVEKVVCAVDCGVAISPDVIKAQMEGGIGYGLSSIVGEAITLDDGKVRQSNFFDYLPLRIDKMPEVEVHIVASAEAPTGVGEPGTPPIGPAVANALRELTGKAITRLPIGDSVA